MPMINLQFNSEVLKMPMNMGVFLPDPAVRKQNANRRMQVLYFLHGMGGDYTTICRYTSLERYLLDGKYHLAVIFPNAHRRFYADMYHGEKYWEYISREIPDIAGAYFNISTERCDTFAAGISMGGYGAMKLALSFPERFAAVASISGALDAEKFAERNLTTCLSDEFNCIFGTPSSVKDSGNDLFNLAGKVAAYKEKPQIYQCCGTEDFLYEDNIRFKDHIDKLGLTHVYNESPGAHTWSYWDENLKKILEWFPFLLGGGQNGPVKGT